MMSGDQKELQSGLPGELPDGPVHGGPSDADATLRLIASLPAPEGLAERMQDGLRVGAARGGGQVLAWPARRNVGLDWLRGSAAAAIVCVVAGGAWWIYASAPAGGDAVAAPVHVRPAGGFSNAGAMHTPDTVLKDGEQGTGVRGQGSGIRKSKGQRDKTHRD
jgi:hypothetical protein